MAGAIFNSGELNTGEVLFGQGGQMAGTVYSGILAGGNVGAIVGGVAAGPNFMFWSGGGRLCSVIPFGLVVSGTVAVQFYDSSQITSGAPFIASGHKILGELISAPNGANSYTKQPIVLNVPFQSGLCCIAPAACQAFTVTWIPEQPTSGVNPAG
jgi:hypothetical protein